MRCQLHNPLQQHVELTQGEYGLLLALAQNARRVLSREQLLAFTHSDSVEVFDRTIDVLIMRLRRKIELNPHQPMSIKTLRGLARLRCRRALIRHFCLQLFQRCPVHGIGA